MVSLPYDIVFRVAEEIFRRPRPEWSAPYTSFPFNHPALLPSDYDPTVSRDLRACALVCREWAAPASDVNIRLLRIRGASSETVEDALSRPGRDLLVRHIQAGREACNDCVNATEDDGKSDERTRCGAVSISLLLSTLSRCTNVRRFDVYEWLDPTAKIDCESYTSFSNITEIQLTGNADRRRHLSLRSFCHLLRLMPGLKRLSFGDLANTSESIADIQPPTFQLESLAVDDARGIMFCSYEWLLAHSTKSLRTFWVYGVFGTEATSSMLNGLKMVSSGLRTLYYIMESSDDFERVLLTCSMLEELCLDNDFRGLPPMLDSQRFLRKLILAATTVNESQVLYFYPANVIRELVDLLLRPREEAFPQLELLAVETDPIDQIVDAPMEELIALRQACEKRGIAFEFERMVELEAGSGTTRPPF